MKKLIALTICTSFLLTSVVSAAGYAAAPGRVDVVAAATETTTPAPTPAPKPATPAVKPAPVVKPAPAVKPTVPVPVVKPVAAVQSKYQDGVYVAFGNAYSKGTEGAKVTIKNGKVADIELMRTSTKLIDRDVRQNYMGLWFAYEPMKQRLLGKTREEAQKADAVAGATRSSEGWIMSVDRAFARALTVKPEGMVYFDGEHMGVDPQGKYMVFVTYEKNKLTAVKIYPFDAKDAALDEKTMSAEQLSFTSALAKEILAKGMAAQAVKGQEAETKAVLNAFWDAEQNAKVVNDSKYVDGFYSAYGAARDKGVERADVVIRNGKLVDVKLYRLGSNLIDRGATAYETVVAANAPMVAKLKEHGSFIVNYDDKVDAVAGATESSHSWNLAVERAFEKALKVPAAGQYFEGTFAGVDNQSKVLVLVDIAADKVTKVQVHLFGADKKLIKKETMFSEQQEMVVNLEAGLLAKGLDMADLSNKALSAAAKAAYKDALANASKKMGNYMDGTFTAYGHTYDKGSNRADVTLRNGSIVDVKVARVGQNMVDRGESAYAEVVKNIPGFTKKFWEAATRENVAKVDVVSGATASGDGFKYAIDAAYKKAEIKEPYRAAFLNGEFPGTDKAKSVYVIVTVEKNVPVKMQVFFLDAAGKVKANDKLVPEENIVKAEIELPMAEGQKMHKYAYRAAAFGANDSEKAVSARVVEAINAALVNAGR